MGNAEAKRLDDANYEAQGDDLRKLVEEVEYANATSQRELAAHGQTRAGHIGAGDTTAQFDGHDHGTVHPRCQFHPMGVGTTLGHPAWFGDTGATVQGLPSGQGKRILCYFIRKNLS